MTSLEKLVPTFEDAATLLRLLARSATGQEFSSYTTISTGPRRPGDLDGPEQYHVVLLDNGRSALIGTRVPGHAALHPLLGLHEPLSGLRRGRRPCLWLGLSRADGRGIDAEPDRHRGGRTSAERLDLLRALRERLPGQDPVAEDDAALARARIRQKAEPAGLPHRPFGCGHGWRAGRRSITRSPRSPAGCSAGPAAAAAGSARLPLAAGWTGGARYAGAGGPQLSQPLGASGRKAELRDERGARTNPRRHPELARVAAGSIRRRRRNCAPASRRIAAIWFPARATALDEPEADRAVRRDGRGGADDGSTGGLARGGAGGGRALSRRREPSGRARHGSRPEPRRDPVGHMAACCRSAAAGPRRRTGSA